MTNGCFKMKMNENSTTNQNVGIGITVERQLSGEHLIVDVREGLGAANAGLKIGWILRAVDFREVKGLQSREVKEMICGPKDSVVILTVLSLNLNGGKVENFHVFRSLMKNTSQPKVFSHESTVYEEHFAAKGAFSQSNRKAQPENKASSLLKMVGWVFGTSKHRDGGNVVRSPVGLINPGQERETMEAAQKKLTDAMIHSQKALSEKGSLQSNVVRSERAMEDVENLKMQAQFTSNQLSELDMVIEAILQRRVNRLNALRNDLAAHQRTWPAPNSVNHLQSTTLPGSINAEALAPPLPEADQCEISERPGILRLEKPTQRPVEAPLAAAPAARPEPSATPPDLPRQRLRTVAFRLDAPPPAEAAGPGRPSQSPSRVVHSKSRPPVRRRSSDSPCSSDDGADDDPAAAEADLAARKSELRSLLERMEQTMLRMSAGPGGPVSSPGPGEGGVDGGSDSGRRLSGRPECVRAGGGGGSDDDEVDGFCGDAEAAHGPKGNVRARALEGDSDSCAPPALPSRSPAPSATPGAMGQVRPRTAIRTSPPDHAPVSSDSEGPPNLKGVAGQAPRTRSALRAAHAPATPSKSPGTPARRGARWPPPATDTPPSAPQRPSPAAAGTLRVVAIEAAGLSVPPGASGGRKGPSCSVQVGPLFFQTRPAAAMDPARPVWNEAFEVPLAEIDAARAVLRVRVFAGGALGRDDALGEAVLPLREALPGPPRWFPLSVSGGGDGGSSADADRGAVCLRFVGDGPGGVQG